MGKERTGKVNAAMQRAEESMRRFGMLPEKGGLILCAVSGGLDSVCLLHFLREMSKKEGFRLAAAHYNHCLRGEESEADARFTEELCADWGIPCVAGEGDVAKAAEEEGWSLEEAARNCRYAFLERTAAVLGAEKIATAHQAEDNAETVLLQLARGSGSEGLGGIPPVRGRMIRPFLSVTREELSLYAAENGIPHREDGSNLDLRFARNRVRHEILPGLREIHPAAVEAIGRAAQVQRRESELLRRIAEAELGEIRKEAAGVSVGREQFLRTEPCLIPRMLGILLEAAEIGRKDVTARHFDAAEELILRGREGSEIHLPEARVMIGGGRVSVLRKETEVPEAAEISPGESLLWGGYHISCKKAEENFTEKRDTIALKCDMISLPITVGSWNRQQGLAPAGGHGRRSLKRLFAERGISPAERERTPVFCTDGQICAAAGIGADERFLTGEGEEAIVLTIEKIERDH